METQLSLELALGGGAWGGGGMLVQGPSQLVVVELDGRLLLSVKGEDVRIELPL